MDILYKFHNYLSVLSCHTIYLYDLIIVSGHVDDYLIAFHYIFTELSCHHCKLVESTDIGYLIEHSTQCPSLGVSYSIHNEVMFRCFVCSYHSRHKGDVKKHVRKHTGDRPYKCIYCNYKSAQTSNVQIHMKIKHNVS